VNNIDLRVASHKDAAAVLKNCSDTANLVVDYKYDGSFCFCTINYFIFPI
jgi:hypothetical protein